MVELAAEHGESQTKLEQEILETGARLIPGYIPVPMRGDHPSVVFTVKVDDAQTEERLRHLPNVVQVYGDPEIQPFGMSGRNRA